MIHFPNNFPCFPPQKDLSFYILHTHVSNLFAQILSLQFLNLQNQFHIRHEVKKLSTELERFNKEMETYSKKIKIILSLMNNLSANPKPSKSTCPEGMYL